MLEVDAVGAMECTSASLVCGDDEHHDRPCYTEETKRAETKCGAHVNSIPETLVRYT